MHQFASSLRRRGAVIGPLPNAGISDETGRLALEPTQSGQVGQWFTDPDKNEVYVTDSLVETEDQILAEVHSEDPQTWLAETQFNLSFDADWSQAEILP